MGVIVCTYISQYSLWFGFLAVFILAEIAIWELWSPVVVVVVEDVWGRVNHVFQDVSFIVRRHTQNLLDTS